MQFLQDNAFLILISILFALGGWDLIQGTVRRNILAEEKGLTIGTSILKSQIALGGENKFDAYRKILFFVFLAFSAVFMIKDLRKGLVLVLVVFLIFFITDPAKKFFKGKNAYEFMKARKIKSNRPAYKKELYDVVVQMKNLLISNGESEITIQYVLQRLLPYTDTIKPFMSQLVSYNMTSDYEKAAEYFKEIFDDKLADDFIYIISRFDGMTFEEYIPLVDTLLLNFQEEEATEQEKQTQKKSQMLFMLSSAQIIGLIGNLIVIIFVDTISKINLTY